MGNGEPSRNHAKLFIPGHDGNLEALRWRFRLIEKEGIYPADNLLAELKSSITKTLSEVDKNRLAQRAKAPEIVLDEVERAQLFVTTILQGSDKASAKQLLSLNRQAVKMARIQNKSLEQFANENPEYVAHTRMNHESLGRSYLKKVVSKIRAKVAFQEVVATIAPNEMIPFMVSCTPKYLACSAVQHWIKVHQFRSFHGSKTDQQESRKLLQILGNAIKGDPRSFKKRKYPYWSLNHQYEDLSSWFSSFRDAHSKKELDKDLFEMFFQNRKIPRSYKKLILNSKFSAKQLALEVLTDLGRIDDPKAFKDFQPIVSKLREKHHGAEIMLILEDFLDLPTHSPEMLIKIDYLAILEKVSL